MVAMGQARGRISGSNASTGPAARSRTTTAPTMCATCNLTNVHYLSGAVGVEGAEPGDLLVVDLWMSASFQESQWGFTGIFAEAKRRWLPDRVITPKRGRPSGIFSGIYTTLAPYSAMSSSPALLIPASWAACLRASCCDTWNKRERSFSLPTPDRVPPLWHFPLPTPPIIGRLKGAARDKAARGRRAHGPAAGTRRQLRHQEPHRAARRSTSRST